MWEKEKLLVMSNFSFSHSVFQRAVLQTRKKKNTKKQGIVWERLKFYVCQGMMLDLPHGFVNLSIKCIFMESQLGDIFLSIYNTSRRYPLARAWRCFCLSTGIFSSFHNVCNTIRDGFHGSSDIQIIVGKCFLSIRTGL